MPDMFDIGDDQMILEIHFKFVLTIFNIIKLQKT